MMSKPDWKELQSQFAAAYASTGISPKEWCEQRGLNYNNARRYIKKPARKNAQKKTAQKTAQSPQAVVTAQGGKENNPVLNCAKPDPKRSHFCADLTDKENLFVSYYLECRNKYEAYKKAGYTGGDRNARMLYRKTSVARAINQGIEQLSEQAILSAQDILKHWHEIAIADPGEISQMRRCCCRYCWGENFLYQWRDIEEFDKAAEKATKDSKPEPEYGGLGFIPNDDPNPDCPKCAGEGVADVHLSDTRDVVGPARRLIAGVKKTKFGIEVTTRDQDAALKNLAAFHNLASSEQDRELRLLEIERVRLSNEKIKAEIENLRNGPNGNEQIIIHNSLKPPGAE
ncbi:Terminase small subunit [Serratia quinivorans]|uniref:terminase small subunit n=1 Tax=Serratia quinivorans TaxID=137545 RepID=UPI00217706EE|nr:terminase small subunit [Serratia quinivorans]CAI1525929.1 Terminase small subunit [Serratia quinivorans]